MPGHVSVALPVHLHTQPREWEWGGGVRGGGSIGNWGGVRRATVGRSRGTAGTRVSSAASGGHSPSRTGGHMACTPDWRAGPSTASTWTTTTTTPVPSASSRPATHRPIGFRCHSWFHCLLEFIVPRSSPKLFSCMSAVIFGHFYVSTVICHYLCLWFKITLNVIFLFIVLDVFLL